jgi:hypothetical protein
VRRDSGDAGDISDAVETALESSVDRSSDAADMAMPVSDTLS